MSKALLIDGHVPWTGKDEADTAEYVVDFFTSIADQFQPLTEEDIPPNCEIATAFRSVRKRSKKE